MPASWPKLLTLLGGLVSIVAGPVAPVRAQQTTVLVVRHAEKTSEASDAVLNEVGWERARDLLRLTEEAEVTALYASQYARAQQTLEPIAQSLDLEILVHEARDSEGLARRILTEHAGRVVLVSGHSNTVPEIVAALGGPEPDPIDDAEYDNLYIVSVSAGGDEATVLHLHFGLPAVAP